MPDPIPHGQNRVAAISRIGEGGLVRRKSGLPAKNGSGVYRSKTISRMWKTRTGRTILQARYPLLTV